MLTQDEQSRNRVSLENFAGLCTMWANIFGGREMDCPLCSRKNFNSVSSVYMHLISYHKATPVFLTDADIAFIQKLLMGYGHKIDRKLASRIWESIKSFKEMAELGS